MRRPLLVVALLSLFAFAADGALAADCERTLAGKFAKFTRIHMKLLQHCRELVLTGHATGPCPDPQTATQMEKARTKFRQVVNRECGGDDETCGSGGDDVDLGSVGWDFAQCPDVHDGNCSNAIGHCGDVANCLICTGEAGVAATMALVYDDFEDPVISEVARCQLSMGRSVARYFDATTNALATCEQRDLADLGSACPDAVKAAPRLDAAEEKLVNRICNACGSSDDLCGGDDLIPEWIGFPASCPAVTPPGGSSCAHPINQLTDIIACVHCVTDFAVGCLDPLAVPRLKSYPAQCH